jgi:hypothetical protein
LQSSTTFRIPFTIAIAATLLALLAIAPRAGAKTVLSETASAGATTAKPCSTSLRPGDDGVYTREFTSAVPSVLEATLSGGSGDWDLIVFSKRTGEPVAGSAQPGSEEIAGGYSFTGEKLVAQACALPGASGTPQIEVELTPIEGEPTPAPSLVRVALPDEGAEKELTMSGLDVTHSVGSDWADVVVYGQEDRGVLARHGLSFSTRVENLSKQSERQRLAEERTELRAGEGFPSGRTGTYRRLFDYEEELKALAAENPGLVRLITLPEKTYEGRSVIGIEISKRVNVRNGKPTYMQMGVHHAREWPSGEHAIEWAYQLLTDYEAGDKQAVKLVKKTRATVIPIVNPDGFNASREAGELQGAAGGRSASSETAETVNIVTHPVEYRRKNCRFLDDSEGGSCLQPDLGLAAAGVDPNRNYGGFWGGPGASTDPTAADYRGPGPFSEPETRNIQNYISTHQVTAFITNHTFTGLLLRPPALQSSGVTVDEPVYKGLGAQMASRNGYENLPSYELYDTSGGTEDWAYYSTGAFGFTFEIGKFAFHPSYAETVAEWNGTSTYFEQNGGNVKAYYDLAKAAANPKLHAVIEGKGPKKGTVTLTKQFKTATSPVLDDSGAEGDVIKFDDKLETVARIRKRGRFKIALNPSTRPVVAQEKGEKGAGPPSDPIAFSGDPSTTVPCADAATEDPTCWNDHAFTVPDEPGKSNAEMTIRADWASPVTDWDMSVYVDTNGDGSSEGETNPVATSQTGTNTFEQAAVGDLEPGQKYVIRMVNYSAAEPYSGAITFSGPEAYQPGKREKWTLVAKNRKGKVVKDRKLYIERGQVKTLNLVKKKKGKGGKGK